MKFKFALMCAALVFVFAFGSSLALMSSREFKISKVNLALWTPNPDLTKVCHL
jgi:hypothetical protein